jgi:glycosyltransferase involved in cell wall biosynthesis
MLSKSARSVRQRQEDAKTIYFKQAMRILHVASGDLWAGAESQLYLLACAQAGDPETAITVVLMNDGILADRLRHAGILVVVVDERYHSVAQTVREVARLIKQRRIDMVHTHRAKENLVGALAVLLAGRGVSIRTAHGSPERSTSDYSIRERIIGFVDRFVGRYLQACVVAVSGELQSRLSAFYPASHLRTVANGIAELHNQQVFRHRVADETLVLACIGRLVSVKRFDVAIAALDAARRILRQPVELWVAGDGPLLSQLEEQAKQLGIAGHVRFLGFVENIPGLLADVDLLLVPSDHEGMPMVVLEAMRQRVLVVAHAVGGLPDVLDSGRAGILLPTQDPVSWANAIRDSARIESRRVMLSEAERRVNDQFSISATAAAYRSIYSRLAKSEG